MKLLHPDMRVSYCLRAFRAGIRDTKEAGRLARAGRCEEAQNLYARVDFLLRKPKDVFDTVIKEHERLPEDMFPLIHDYCDLLDIQKHMKDVIRIYCELGL